MKNLLQFPAELTSYKTYQTKSEVQVSFELQDMLNAEQIAKLLACKGATGWLVFNPNEDRLEVTDIPTEPVKEKDGKSKSERLYNVLFVYWKECTDKTTPFDRFRDDHMEKIIESIKAKLPPKE